MTEHPERQPSEGTRLVVDETAGRLARWLRIFGLDVEYIRACEPSVVARFARQSGRKVVTRNHALAERLGAAAILLESGHLNEQLKQVVAEVGVRRYNLFSRCTICNAILARVSKDSVRGRVPRYVYMSQDAFAACPVCGRYYWQGTHWQRMLAEIHTILEVEANG